MLIACVREKWISTQCRENAAVLVPETTLHALLHGSSGIA
jgi:hypothetical protein